MDIRRVLVAGAAVLVLVISIGAATISTTVLIAVDVLMAFAVVAAFRTRAIPLFGIAVLGAVPFAAVNLSGYNVPVIILVSPIAAGFALFHSVQLRSSGWTRLAMVTGSVLIATGTLAFFVTNGRNGGTDVLEYMKWLSASLLFVPALCYGPVWVTRARRVFAVSTGLGASFALAATYTSQAQTLLDSLGKLGYLRSADDARYFILNGVSQGQRVTGSYTDPNIAAIFFICGMAACSAINNRVLRPAVRCILLVAAAGTLSRGAMLGATVAVVLFVALSRAGLWRRSLALAVLALGAAVLLSIPATRDRIATTGTSADIGGNDRITQLHTFAQAMGDDWWFGLGFGRPEFRDGAIAYQVNQVANAPLISIYRGGLVAGAGFVAWYATALALGLRLMRTRSKHGRAQGLALVAFVITALTGYGTALIPELVALFSLQIGLCATLAANAVSEPEEAAPSQVGTLVSARLAPLKPEPAETRRAAAWEPLATGPLDDRVRSTQSSGRGTLGAP